MSVFGAVKFSTWSPGNSLGDYVDEASHQEIANYAVAGPEEVGAADGGSRLRAGKGRRFVCDGTPAGDGRRY